MTDHSELIRNLRKNEYVLARPAADALEAQAKEIAGWREDFLKLVQRIADIEAREEHSDKKWRNEADKASARIAELEAALSSVLTGGNHLALLIGADHPWHTASHDEAMAHYGSGDIYKIWCCWRTMMNAGPVLAGHAALNGEKR
jgi:hypothetical protein